MIKNLIYNLAEKYILSYINDTLERNKDNVASVTSSIQTWNNRINALSKCLDSISKRFEDAHLTDEEIEQSVVEIKGLIDNIRTEVK